jgi:uncharacterized membrane protein
VNIVLWVLQVPLALHTLMGAVWKFRNSDRVVPSLGSIPRKAWLVLCVFELLCSLGLLLPALTPSLAILAPIGAACIGAEMLLFCAVHLQSGATRHGPVAYWLVVAVLCAVVVYGRLVPVVI